jgi:oxygen-dependent protoporphyrinogen oxidase
MKIAIVGGGISGLSLAYYLQNEFDVTVFEKDKWGGKARSVIVDGALFEEGVNGFLNNSLTTLELAKEIGITPIKANENAKKRFIYDDKLISLPSSLIGFIKSDILSLKAKIRILKEFFIKPECKEESVAEFATRRLGKEFNDKMMVPMVAGIYASTPNELSMNAAFKKLKDIECKYGSLFKGMIKLKRGGTPTGELHSFKNGMSEFIEKLKSSTKANFIKKEITSLKELKDFDKIILATPAYESAKLVDGKLKELLQKIKYNPVAVVGFKADVEPKGFGVLTLKEKTLGILMDKYVFENRNGIRCMVGGARFREIENLSKDEIIEIVKKDLKKIINLEPEIIFFKLHKKAIPNYSLAHQELVEEIMKEAKKVGIYLTGNAYNGVSFNESIANSFNLAQEIKGEKNV